MGHLLKRTNGLLDGYLADSPNPGYDQELKALIFAMEAEGLSPFETRKS